MPRQANILATIVAISFTTMLLGIARALGYGVLRVGGILKHLQVAWVVQEGTGPRLIRNWAMRRPAWTENKDQKAGHGSSCAYIYTCLVFEYG